MQGALLSDCSSRERSGLRSPLLFSFFSFFPFYIALASILRRRRHDARHPRDTTASLSTVQTRERERERERERRNESVSPNDDPTLPFFVPSCCHRAARRPLGSLRYPILDESGQHNLLETR